MPGRGKCGRMSWRKRFRGQGYRITIPREVIMDVLSASESHLSAEDIYMKVHRMSPHIGLTTVYRTLDILTEMGMISKFDFGDGRSRYELIKDTREGHHHHLICTRCNRVIDYFDFINEELEFIKRAEEGLSKKYDFEIRSHVIQFHGICGECRKRKTVD
jgi:Fur family ferric uptake transcriptional regulator